MLGPPASGKGTQGSLLSEWAGIPTTSTGAILRKEKQEGTEVGKEADRLTRDGNLAPDDLILKVVRSWLERHDGAFIFDGFPRTLPQAEGLEKILEKRSTPLHRVFLLDLSMETIRERVRRRVVCSDCGKAFNLGVHVEKLEEPCPACGGTLERRRDDSEAALERRMEVYREKTLPLVEFYEQRGVLTRVPADREAREVFEDMKKELQS